MSVSRGSKGRVAVPAWIPLKTREVLTLLLLDSFLCYTNIFLMSGVVGKLLLNDN